MIENKKNLNIKDLVIEIPRVSSVSFHPDKYITNHEWAMLDRRVEGAVGGRLEDSA